ncbi:interferon-inducible double-stranded RNA-dependent protein kinase activator A homolog isoform X2 [Hippoglossus stenolepis]|uniref:interferon-inducible double-stranded RNA-dependent protein kinase activator A homolog isoform X2 n=1 Tax=Hippoglossus stenolepis TaxID=195615 RepID=UPI001FAF28EA|nr:interferon-inducible double-stranded RNA-dependent protein kinase activator A homolog isoform X2 [Hippoglossus stenolepis]XP_047198675.1 interferon-inducible double-stranded RNA-dependent protein kinase activator A homolog isoform X2 [Hippoglossus stenolepis]XP_047198676.1 interferon-inducible double-stranded RNA-dependent protein kinase activator A homolog isoform X2 [Hippoglossus stenolepis]
MSGTTSRCYWSASDVWAFPTSLMIGCQRPADVSDHQQMLGTTRHYVIPEKNRHLSEFTLFLVQGMEFQQLLLEVGKALSTDNVKALAFLCTNILNRNTESVKSANDLFSRLVEQDHLSQERPYLLTELLRTIQRIDLVRKFHLNDGEPTSLISPYRKLLYNLSEELTTDDSSNVKFLLNDELPKRILDEKTSLLEVFLRMEQMNLLGDNNLNKLENIIHPVCPRLKVQITQFKAQQESSFTTLPLSTEASNSACSLSYLCSDTVDVSGSQENRTFSENQTSTNSKALRRYSMTQAKRGICLIINNCNFSRPSLKHREGTKVDEQCLSHVFKWLGFDVEVHLDCTSEKMLSVLRELGGRDHRQMDCVACCVLSHGLEGRVYGVDTQTVDIKDLKEPLNALNCPTLAEKPKLFFVQACQGQKEQDAVYIEADGPEPSLVCNDALKDSIPTEADFLMSMATVPSFVSFRDKKKGTWFIQSLCKNLVELVPGGLDLLSILTKVNDDVSLKTKTEGEKKQMPQQASTLRKNVVFPVPKTPSPRLPSV